VSYVGAKKTPPACGGGRGREENEISAGGCFSNKAILLAIALLFKK